MQNKVDLCFSSTLKFTWNRTQLWGKRTCEIHRFLCVTSYLRAYTGTKNNQIYIWGEKNRVNSNAFCRNKRVDNTFFVDLIILVGRVILLMPLLHYLKNFFLLDNEEKNLKLQKRAQNVEVSKNWIVVETNMKRIIFQNYDKRKRLILFFFLFGVDCG